MKHIEGDSSESSQDFWKIVDKNVAGNAPTLGSFIRGLAKDLSQAPKPKSTPKAPTRVKSDFEKLIEENIKRG